MNKEQAYDEKIAPLMKQIIAASKEHGIAMIASFAIPTEEDEGLVCTTCLQDENNRHGFGHAEAFRMIRNESRQFQLRTEHGNGSQTLTTFV